MTLIFYSKGDRWVYTIKAGESTRLFTTRKVRLIIRFIPLGSYRIFDATMSTLLLGFQVDVVPEFRY